MKKYILKIFTFLLPILILSALMELMLRHIPNDFKNKKNYLDSYSDKVEVLILGGSHTLYGIDPSYIKMTGFNASQVSQTLDLDLALLKNYMGRWSDLKFIVIPVSYTSLFEKLEKSNESWRIKNYVIYYKLGITQNLSNYTEILSNKLGTNIKRLHSFYFLKKNNAFCTQTGWDTSYATNPKARDLKKDGFVAAKRHRIEDDQYFDELVSIVDTILFFAESNNSKVILLTSPVLETYRENLNQTQLTRTITTANIFTKKYKNCFYFNFFEDSSFTEDYFYDADHLNKLGAEKMSLMVDSIICEIDKIDKKP